MQQKDHFCAWFMTRVTMVLKIQSRRGLSWRSISTPFFCFSYRSYPRNDVLLWTTNEFIRRCSLAGWLNVVVYIPGTARAPAQLSYLLALACSAVISWKRRQTAEWVEGGRHQRINRDISRLLLLLLLLLPRWARGAGARLKSVHLSSLWDDRVSIRYLWRCSLNECAARCRRRLNSICALCSSARMILGMRFNRMLLWWHWGQFTIPGFPEEERSFRCGS